MERTRSALALWGGVECTVNRVRDGYASQLTRSGHQTRVGDLDAIARTGIRKVRYPVLWELACPDGPGKTFDWSWADERLGRLRELGIEPIVGFLHHGSGPPSTNLLDEGFATGLEAFARAFAERFPWVVDYTPVNEPLTTARFSALYGFWYPHVRDARLFARALVNQCHAVALAMRAIREINPQARLIQTEDLGKVSSTPRLSYQAEFDNRRRWLSLDLLCGRVKGDHPLFRFLLAGSSKDALASFCRRPCPPDVVGVNYYVTSDRYLDHRLGNFPRHMHGGNDREPYVDVEAVRTATRIRGHEAVLEETWQRYHIPVAITEVHLDCHREEQLRWLAEAWNAALALRRQGVEVEAVTLWSLFGAFDWNSLCTRADGYYESGAFDVRSDPPRPTALARAARSICSSGTFSHPTLNHEGWWWRTPVAESSASLAGRAACPPAGSVVSLSRQDNERSRPLLIVGEGSSLTRGLRQACSGRAIDCAVVLPHDDIEAVLRQHDPWAIVFAESTSLYGDLAVQRVAECAQRARVPLTVFSSTATTGGAEARATSVPVPANEGELPQRPWENLVLDLNPKALILRTSSVLDSAASSVIREGMARLRQGAMWAAPHDVLATPAYLPDLVGAALDLVIDEEVGVWHLNNTRPLVWSQVFEGLCDRLGFDRDLVQAVSWREVARRGPWLTLGRPITSKRGEILPSIDDALGRFCSMHAAEVASATRGGLTEQSSFTSGG